MNKQTDLKRMASILAACLREKNIRISHGESLDIVAKQFGFRDWNGLSARTKLATASGKPAEVYKNRKPEASNVTEFRSLFPDAALPGCNLSAADTVRHPFPSELHGLPALAFWRKHWEAEAMSTRDRPFFPPTIPFTLSLHQGLSFELRKDWSASPSGTDDAEEEEDFTNGACCVLVRDRGQIIGVTSWDWWGDFKRINGVNFCLQIRTGDRWLYVNFDLRGTDPLPTHGPIVAYDDNEEHSQAIRSNLERMVRLGPPRYAD